MSLITEILPHLPRLLASDIDLYSRRLHQQQSHQKRLLSRHMLFLSHELGQLLGMANKFLVLVHNGAPSYLYVTRLNLVLKNRLLNQ